MPYDATALIVWFADRLNLNVPAATALLPISIAEIPSGAVSVMIVDTNCPGANTFDSSSEMTVGYIPVSANPATINHSDHDSLRS
jgi:hypothetical protein